MSDNIKACPWCGETILAVARKCKHCGEYLESAPVTAVTPRPADRLVTGPRAERALPTDAPDLGSRYRPRDFQKAHGWFVFLFGLAWFLLLLGLVFVASALWDDLLYPQPSHFPNWGLFDYAARDRREVYTQVGLALLAFGLVASLASGALFLILLYRCWGLIQDGWTRTTPGKAVGFLFIPFFNLYWIFVAVHGLATGLNHYAMRRGLAIRPAAAGTALAYCILAVCSALPVLNLLLAIPLAVLLFILAGSLKKTTVAIAESESAEGPSSRRSWAGALLAGACAAVLGAALLAVYWLWPAAPARILSGQGGAFSRIVFSPDGKYLAAAGMDGKVRLWDVTAATVPASPLRTFPINQAQARDVAFSPDGRLLATAAGGVGRQFMDLPGELKVWDVQTGQELRSLRGHHRRILSLAFSPDEKHLASTSQEFDLRGGERPGEIRIWDVASGKEAGVLRGHAKAINCVAYSPDGRRLASASNDETVKVWDTAAGKELFTCRGPYGRVTSVVFSPDGKLLASSGSGRRVNFWDAATGEALAPLAAEEFSVSSLAFSPDGQLLAGDCGAGQVKVWRLASRKPAFAFKGSAPAFHPEGRQLATIRGGQVWLWDLPPE